MREQAPEMLNLSTRTFYATEDLDTFKSVLQDAMADLRASGSPLVAGNEAEVTKIRLAAGIFMFAEGGERHPDRLKELAVDSVIGSQIPAVILKPRGETA